MSCEFVAAIAEVNGEAEDMHIRLAASNHRINARTGCNPFIKPQLTRGLMFIRKLPCLRVAHELQCAYALSRSYHR